MNSSDISLSLNSIDNDDLFDGKDVISPQNYIDNITSVK